VDVVDVRALAVRAAGGAVRSKFKARARPRATREDAVAATVGSPRSVLERLTK
jgi:hypothetical protein